MRLFNATLAVMLLCCAGIPANELLAENRENLFTPVQQKKVQQVTPGSYHDLENIFNNPHEHIIDIVTAFPADFSTIRNSAQKKRLFILAMIPIVSQENRRLREKRNLVKLFLNTDSWPKEENHYQWIMRAAKHYRAHQSDASIARKQLLLKIDEIPMELVIAQAAIESGWGTSRFAQQGNSLFGQWTFSDSDEGGLVPEDRDEGKNHRIKTFPDISSSVRAYLYNINTNNAYRNLRRLRAEMRKNNQTLDAHELAIGLSKYSQRGHAYVKEIRQIINSKMMQTLLTRAQTD